MRYSSVGKSEDLVPADKPAPRKKAKKAPSGLSQKAIALTVGASRDRSIWCEVSLADALQHLKSVDESTS